MADFPFIPTWRNGVTVRLSHKTDIFAARDGQEQRRSLRDTARTAIEFAVQLHGSERTLFQAMMSTQAADQWSLADPVTFTRLVAAAPAGATALPTEGADWLVSGCRIAVRNGRRLQYITVSSVSGGIATLAAPIVAAQSEGAFVHAVVVGRFTLDGSSPANTSQMETVSMTLEVDPGSERAVNLSGGVDVFDNREVWLQLPNWTKAPTIELKQERDVTDYEFGRTSYTVPAAWAASVTQADYLNANATEAANLIELFHRQRGRAGEMFVPTWRDDMVLVADLADGGTTLLVAGTDVADYFVDHPVFRAIVIRLNDGRRLFRKVTGLATASGNTLVTVDREWVYDITVSEVRAIHWLPLQRFATDSLSIDYLTDTVSQFRVSTMTLPYAVSEVTIEGWTMFGDVFTEIFGSGDEAFAMVDRFDYLLNVVHPSIT